MTTPDRLGVVLGYRMWQLDTSSGAVAKYSLRSKTQMEPGSQANFWWSTSAPTKAECRKCERPPSFNYRCGLYAFSHCKRGNPAVYNQFGCHVYGAVLAWGQIVHHKSFFRAENALPIAFMQSAPFSPSSPRNDPFTERARTRLAEIAQLLHAPIFDDVGEFEVYVREEAAKW